MADKIYLVRGARLQCTKGTHTRRLNIPRDHGMRMISADAYDGHPYVTSKDCEVGEDKNIDYFGICSAYEDGVDFLSLEEVEIGEDKIKEQLANVSQKSDSDDNSAKKADSKATEEKKSINLQAAKKCDPWKHGNGIEAYMATPAPGANGKTERIIVVMKKEDNFDEDSDEVKTGAKCYPCFMKMCWENTKEDVKNGDKFENHGGEEYVTTQSYLRCKYGGIITVVHETMNGLDYDGSKDK